MQPEVVDFPVRTDDELHWLGGLTPRQLLIVFLGLLLTAFVFFIASRFQPPILTFVVWVGLPLGLTAIVMYLPWHNRHLEDAIGERNQFNGSKKKLVHKPIKLGTKSELGSIGDVIDFEEVYEDCIHRRNTRIWIRVVEVTSHISVDMTHEQRRRQIRQNVMAFYNSFRFPFWVIEVAYKVSLDFVAEMLRNGFTKQTAPNMVKYGRDQIGLVSRLESRLQLVDKETYIVFWAEEPFVPKGFLRRLIDFFRWLFRMGKAIYELHPREVAISTLREKTTHIVGQLQALELDGQHLTGVELLEFYQAMWGSSSNWQFPINMGQLTSPIHFMVEEEEEITPKGPARPENIESFFEAI